MGQTTWERESLGHTTKECLHDDPTNLSSIIASQHKPSNVNNTLPIKKQLQFSIGHSSIVQKNPLTDLVPHPLLERERTTPDRGAVGGVAGGEWLDGAEGFVGCGKLTGGG